MPEPAPTAAGSPAPVKKEKVEKEKEKVPPLFKSKSAKLENDVDSTDNKLHTTSLKSLVLNRASTFPTCTESVGRSTRGPNYSVKGNCSSNDTTNGGSKLLTREATLAAIAAARSEIAASKGGGGLKNGLEIYGQSNQNHAVEIGSAQNSDTDDENLHRVALSKDFKQVASVGKGGVPVPLVNAWATGRPRNGELVSDIGALLLSHSLQNFDLVAVLFQMKHLRKAPAAEPPSCWTLLLVFVVEWLMDVYSFSRYFQGQLWALLWQQ
jgi:hypothetical protein